jgi:hypothetical protein
VIVIESHGRWKGVAGVIPLVHATMLSGLEMSPSKGGWQAQRKLRRMFSLHKPVRWCLATIPNVGNLHQTAPNH